MRYSALYFLGAGWTVLISRRSGGGVGAQSDDLTAPTTPSPTATPPDYDDCTGYLPHIKDGYCDDALNVADCGYDGGDCCACTCVDGVNHTCGTTESGYDCKDPAVPDGCGSTPSPAAIYGFPDCKGYMPGLQNGYCSDDLNNAECGYDGGDCCRCTCRDYTRNYYTWTSDDYNPCGSYGYDCQDPNASTDCDTDSPTPSPTVNPDHQYCKGVLSYIANGNCNSYNNNAECAFDGGDCCPCTCEGYYCGPYYDCLDPEAQCTTSSTDTYYGYYTRYTSSTTSTGDGYYSSSSTSYTTATSSEDYDDDDFNSVPSDDDACPGRAYGGNGYCTPEHNTAECDYDGGDCCECTCIDSASFVCGYAGYDCLDPVCDSYVTADGDDVSAGATAVDPSSSSSSSLPSAAIIGIVIAAILGFCCFGSLIASGCAVVFRKCSVSKPTGESNYAAWEAAPAVAPRASMPALLPPTAPTHVANTGTESNSYQGSYGVQTGHGDRHLAAHIQQYESARSRHEDRQIEAAMYERSLREQTIAETMYQGSTRNQSMSSSSTIGEHSRPDGEVLAEQRSTTSGIDADIVGADECESTIVEKGLAATGAGRSYDDHQQGNATRSDIETGSVRTGEGAITAEVGSVEDGGTDATVAQASVTNSECAPSDEESVIVDDDVVGDEEGEPAGDAAVEDRSSDAEDVVVVAVETPIVHEVISGEESQDDAVDAVGGAETNLEDTAVEETGDEGHTTTFIERDNISSSSSDHVEVGGEENGVVENGTIEVVDDEEAPNKE